MERQEAFEKAVRGLAGQGWERSVTTQEGPYTQCCYRGDGGRKCAIGHLIPDEDYSPRMEGGAITWPQVLETCGLSSADRGFAVDMQIAHDRAESPEGMLRNYREFAEQYDLTWPADVPTEVA